ncbi:ABC-2 type transporter [Allomeiothermus silvanus DSM 9946]|uniref:Transport permease protein n=1 Tax=Allomeiothermus silvanus (strain ATCC 700542 / DSM 9946 / NBRC 106475 / NCIMB 13440 / VI-R2) TaxID=526227 RepID=D7BE46_ALLS1|nr:ABC transporter permease [Allomeiothermus silvanus]ADH64904.1 ABC-2 type transporter [Allomeiothermus silvanus DSM 9946]
MNRIAALARKEFTQIRRDHVLSRLIVGLPIVMTLLFGYAINFTLSGIRLAVYDGSQDRISQYLLQELQKEDRFRITYAARRPEEVPQAIQENKARVGLVIPAGALQTVRQDQAVQLEVYVDGSDPNFAFQAQAALRKVLGDVNSRLLAGKVLAGAATAPPLTPTFHTLYNPDNKTAWFMIPGIIGLIMTIFTVLLTALSIVRESESRTMESLIASPIKPYEVVLGKVLPYFVIAALVSLVVLAIGHWVFGVPVRGSLLWLLSLIVLFVLGSLGVGVLISTLARTQIQAVFGTFAYIMPTIFLSGFVFPIEGMPTFFRWLSVLIPTRYLIDGTRGIMLRGAGLEALWIDLVALVIFSTAVLGLASLRFGKRLVA